MTNMPSVWSASRTVSPVSDPEGLKYRDEDWLREQFEDENRSARDIANECDIAGKTLRKWADRFDIDRPSADTPPEKLQNADWLRDQYVEQRQSTVDIAGAVGCTPTTVSKWMKRHGIETRSDSEAARLKFLDHAPHYETTPDGYEDWATQHDGERWHVRVHRLLAVAEFGFDAVADKIVHHKNHIPWDNRPENLDVMDWSEHSSYHGQEYVDGGPWRDEATLREARQEFTRNGLAEKWECTYSTVERWEKKYEIDGIDDPQYEGPWRDEETLREAYRDATGRELAERWDCSETTIFNWLNRFGITKDDVQGETQQPLSDF